MSLGGPLTYFGGKHRFGNRFAALIPPHRVYVEPFVGSGGVFFAKQRRPAAVEVISDIDGRLINFYRQLRHDPETLAKACAIYERDDAPTLNYSEGQFQFWHSPKKGRQEARQRVLAKIEEAYGQKGRDLYQAVAYFVTNRQAFSPKSDFWQGTKREIYEKRVSQFVEYGQRLSNVSINHVPYHVQLLTYNAPDVFIYLDPPYIKETRSRGDKMYRHEMLDATLHEPILQMLVRHKGRWMISGYPHPMYDDYLVRRGWDRREFLGHASIATKRGETRDRSRTEVVWSNYLLP